VVEWGSPQDFLSLFLNLGLIEEVSMLVIVKSAPDTTDDKRGVKLARDMAADVILLQNGVHVAQGERLEGFCGGAYVLNDDVKLRGIREDEIEKNIRRLDYGSLVDLITGEEKVVGMF